MGLTDAEKRNFIEVISPIIQNEAIKRGYPVCSTVIAQAIVESAYGGSVLAHKYHNYFGMKCGSKWRGKSVNLKTKEEYTPGVLTTISDNFRVYDSMVQGVCGYYDFISTKRYANLKTATNYMQYAQYLKQDGYATSSTYINTLCKTVEKYNLTQYDKGYMPMLKEGSRGDSVKILQTYLRDQGFNPGIKIDGIFGKITKIAVIQAQAYYGLTKDGVVGPLTWAQLKQH